MFKLFHHLYSNFIFTKPSVHYFQPKSLNLYFKNALQPKYQLLNLTKYNYVAVDMVQEKLEGSDNSVFTLRLKLNATEIETLPVASFETRRECEDALNVLKNKLYSPEKTWVKFLLLFASIAFVLLFIISFFQNNIVARNDSVARITQSQNIDPTTLTPEMIKQLQQAQIQKNQAALSNPQALNQRLAEQENQAKEYEKLQAQREQALQQARAQANQLIQDNQTKSNPPQVAPSQAKEEVRVDKDPAVTNLMNGLSK